MSDDSTTRAEGDPQTLRRLARECHRDGQYLAALRVYDQLIGLGAADADVWRETGNALSDVGEYAQALGAYQHSLRLDESCAESHNNLSKALYNLGDVAAAVDHSQRAVALSDSLTAWLNLATMIPGCPRATPERILQVRAAFARKLASETLAGTRPRRRVPKRRRRTGRRIRVGYVSSHFHAANYMKPVWGLINQHDRGVVSLHLFNDSPPDKGLPGYQPHPRDRVHATSSLDNPQLSDLILDVGVEILVDLNAYSASDRLALFLEAPANISVAWFNAYATTGLPGIQYLVGDSEVVRPDEKSYFSERIVTLPLSYLTFEVSHPVPPVAPPPCASTGGLTFGSLVAQYKITGPVLDTWAEILRRSPGARLLLANTALKSPQNRAYVQQQFMQRDVTSDRLVLLGPASHYDYLRYYDQIDVALDAFPYNGGTTTMEALWQGVPVLTFDGDRWASRTSQTLIRRTPWSHFVGDNVQQYVELAVRMANSPETPSRLGELRPSMREQLAQSAACDTRRLATSMEAVYRQLMQGQIS